MICLVHVLFVAAVDRSFSHQSQTLNPLCIGLDSSRVRLESDSTRSKLESVYSSNQTRLELGSTRFGLDLNQTRLRSGLTRITPESNSTRVRPESGSPSMCVGNTRPQPEFTATKNMPKTVFAVLGFSRYSLDQRCRSTDGLGLTRQGIFRHYILVLVLGESLDG